MNQETLIFTHIPKTAGMTLIHFLIQEYGEKSNIHLTPFSYKKLPYLRLGYTSFKRVFCDDFKKLSLHQKQEYKVITGHIPFGIHEDINNPYIYITFLRNPVDLLISRYYFDRRIYKEDRNFNLFPQILQERFKVAIDLPLENWVGHESCSYFSNLQTAFLSGIDLNNKEQKKTFYNQPEYFLSIAKNNLKNYYKVFGITEKFDASLVLMQNALDWNIPLYIRENVTHNRPKKEYIDRKVIDKIKNYNQVDLKLYDFAQNYFQDLLQQYKVSEQKIYSFQKINNVYQERYQLWQKYNEELRQRINWLNKHNQTLQKKVKIEAKNWRKNQSWIEKLQKDKDWLEGELKASIAYAESLEKELASLQEKLDSLPANDSQNVAQEWIKTQSELEAIKNSKFWKLGTLWHKMKQSVGLGR